MAALFVKSFLEMSDLSVETRRFGVDRGNMEKDGIFEFIQGTIGTVFPGLKDKKFSLFWKDCDDDFVIMSTDDEMRDALSNEENGSCKIYIRVIEEQNNEQSAAVDGKEKGKHQRCERGQDLTPRFHPHPRYSQHPPHPNHRPMGHRGDPFSRSWGKMGQWGNRERHGRFHDHPHHPFGHRRGHHQYGHDGHFSHGRRNRGQCGQGEKHGGKDSPMNLVPMPHRRWAKHFIQCWRHENLMNATSTSDSGEKYDGKMTLANAGVPPAYAEWLTMKLERWHMKWCSDEMNGEKPRNKEEKKETKAPNESVPVEFRKWTKWYLNSHFGRRDSPRFRRGHHGGRRNGGCRKDAGMQKSILHTEIPEDQRSWTQQFIRDWRIEKKLDEPNSAIPQSSDNEGPTGVDMESTKEMPVPVAYKQWLEIFLPRWHMRTGQIEKSPDQSIKDEKNQFEATVRVEYRDWVKFYMYRNYKNKNSEVQSKDDVLQEKYQKILKTFKKGWLRDEKLLDDESDSSSSSDDETVAVDDKEPEASLG